MSMFAYIIYSAFKVFLGGFYLLIIDLFYNGSKIKPHRNDMRSRSCHFRTLLICGSPIPSLEC